jgi:hypothetical protein
MNDVAADVRQPEIATLISVREFFMIDSHHVENRRMKIVHVHGILDDVEAEVVRFSIRHASADAASGHPDRKALDMMVPAGCAD